MFLLKLVCLLFCAATVNCTGLKKVPCSYEDAACLTKATDAIFTKIVAGRADVESSDPLIKDIIEINTEDLKCVMHNANLTGLLQCRVENVEVVLVNLGFIYVFRCPSIKIESAFEVNGKLDGAPVEGKGTSKITYDKLTFLLSGNYDKHIDNNGLLHTNITNYELEVRVDGNITKEYKGLSGSCVEIADKLEELIRKPVAKSFMDKYVANINSFLKIVPVDDIHFQYV